MDQHYLEENTSERFVAFIDIMGFKHLVLHSPNLERFIEKYSSTFKPLDRDIQRFDICHQLFSDSLYIMANGPDQMQQLINLISFSRRLLLRTLEAKLAIRGAISFGKVIASGDVLVGSPIIEAVQYESMQNWIGIMLAPSCAGFLFRPENLAIKKKLEDESCIRETGAIPIKGSPETIRGLVVDFRPKGADKINDLIRAIENIEIEAGQGEVSKKCKNTIDFLQS